jgi:aromatic ring-cleaving dioxygenase
VNPPADKPSQSYDSFVHPITNDERGGFDVHVYFQQNIESEVKFATELWERIRRECMLTLSPARSSGSTNFLFTVPELRVYRVWDKPIGPHPIAMFEVNLFTPAQFGAFVPWLVINRGPLSALLHPNTGDDIRDHTQRATWLGQPFPLQIGLLRRLLEKRAEATQNN